LLVGIINALGSGISDIQVEDVRSLSAETPKRGGKLRPGDIVAVGAKGGGYHIALIAAKNRFGTALAIFEGLASVPDRRARQPELLLPIYTDDAELYRGGWFLAGHDDALLGLLSGEPELFYKPGMPGSPVNLGRYGAAEKPSGGLRLLNEGEAHVVGLLDGGYRQVNLSSDIQRLLDKG
jgi:hypothetical protein